jgi:hypothetical protein
MINKLGALAICYGAYSVASSIFMFINLREILSAPGNDTPLLGISFLTGTVIYCFISILTIVWIIFIPLILCYMLLVRRKYKLVYNLAAAGCLGFPIGTILGYYAMKILDRDEVKAQFLSQ